MKVLKNDGSIFVEKIFTAIAECYGSDSNPSNQSLLELYTFIGQQICLQGEKAFVAHLAKMLTVQFPTLKGFSLRNLRRMRDFYRTYVNNQALMEKALSLSWTQNAVILGYCETDEQRPFYIGLAIEQKLSKLALMKAIAENAFATASDIQTPDENVEPSFAPVGDICAKPAVDTTASVETACEPFVTACEPPRQGNIMPSRNGGNHAIGIAEIPDDQRSKHISDYPSSPGRIHALPKYPIPMAIQIQAKKPRKKPPPGIL